MKRLLQYPSRTLHVIWDACHRFFWDDGFSRAAGLAYTTLFALVPITAISFSMFYYFEMDRSQVLGAIFEQLLPSANSAEISTLKGEILSNLEQFAENVKELAKGLNVISILILAITSIALLNSIESALNVVWRVTSSRSILAKVTSFWAVLTLGPLFISISLYWTARFAAFTKTESEQYSALQTFFDHSLSVLAMTIALSGLYYLLPSVRVRFRDALFGGFVAACLFEAVKLTFAYYVGLSATYSTLYGVLATVPLFLFWLYVAWVVVLFGAEIAYLSGSITLLQGIKRFATDLGEIGSILGLQILRFIGTRFENGKPPPTESEIAIYTGTDPVLVRSCLEILAEAEIISEPDSRTLTRSLLRAPEKITLDDVFKTFLSKKLQNTNISPQIQPHEFLEVIRKVALRDLEPKAVSSWTVKDLL